MFIQGKPSLSWVQKSLWGPSPLTRPRTPGLLVRPRWSCRPSPAPAEGTGRRWSAACSSSAEPEPRGPGGEIRTEWLPDDILHVSVWIPQPAPIYLNVPASSPFCIGWESVDCFPLVVVFLITHNYYCGVIYILNCRKGSLVKASLKSLSYFKVTNI